jgi:hypothetical protein
MDILRSKHNNFITIGRKLALSLILICVALLAGCGKSTPPDQPLTTDSDTPTASVSATDVPTHITPITVIQGQTNLTTYPGGSVTLAISTSPFALCAIEVNYGLKAPSASLGMGSVTADAKGMASWHWTVTLQAHTGSWPLTVSAILPDGSRTSTQVNAYVTAAPISVQSAALSASPGKDMSLTIATSPFATCAIQYAFEPGRPTRTVTVKADGSGIASWTWIVGKVAAAGTYRVTIIATLADGEASYSGVSATVL